MEASNLKRYIHLRRKGSHHREELVCRIEMTVVERGSVQVAVFLEENDFHVDG